MIKSIRNCCNHDQFKVAIERISNFKLISSPGIFLGGIHTDGRQTHLLNKPGFDKTLMVMMKNRKYSDIAIKGKKFIIRTHFNNFQRIDDLVGPISCTLNSRET